jgi:hypothetical protein
LPDSSAGFPEPVQYDMIPEKEYPEGG